MCFFKFVHGPLCVKPLDYGEILWYCCGPVAIVIMSLPKQYIEPQAWFWAVPPSVCCLVFHACVSDRHMQTDTDNCALSIGVDWTIGMTVQCLLNQGFSRWRKDQVAWKIILVVSDRAWGGGGVLAWCFVCSEVQTCIWPSWCHCHSLSLASVKSRLVLPFWYRLTRKNGR